MAQQLKIKERKFYYCEICPKSFLRKFQLSIHIRTHTGERPFSCPTCKKSFYSKSSLTQHLRIHAGELRYSCDICDHKFAQYGGLHSHKKTHFEQRPFPCSICEKGFKYSQALATHMVTHTRETPYKCTICGKSYSHQGTLKCHIDKIHLKTGLRRNCLFCEKAFPSNAGLFVHLRVHINEKPYVCRLCSMELSNSGCLDLHLRRHVGEKPFGCEECSRKFVDAAGLKLHKKQHSTERSGYQCHICERAYLSKSCYKAHLLVHEKGDKQLFKCRLCRKELSGLESLKAHERQHLLNRRHHCVFCDKGFLNRTNMFYHLRAHTMERTLCWGCLTEFGSPKACYKHKCIKV